MIYLNDIAHEFFPPASLGLLSSSCIVIASGTDEPTGAMLFYDFVGNSCWCHTKGTPGKVWCTFEFVDTMYKQIFEMAGCTIIFTKILRNNSAAISLALTGGFKECFDYPDAPYKIYVMHKEDLYATRERLAS